MKIIILGAGQVGGTLAENLAGENNDITIVDTDSDRLRELQDKFDLRAIITANDKGEYWYTTVLPKPYTVPYDGPVGRLLRAGQRHSWRASHLHYIIRAEGYRAMDERRAIKALLRL